MRWHTRSNKAALGFPTLPGLRSTIMPFHRDQICDYVGGMIPFARTAEERRAANDPRPSLSERYGSHDRYVAAVSKAAARAKAEGFFLQDDAAALIEAAKAGAVLR